MIFAFYFFAAVLIFLSYKSFRGGVNYLAYFKRELAEPKPIYAPFASVIAPCRGLDDGLEENLAALFRQDFPAYEIIFAVDDARDEVVSVIENLIERQEEKKKNNCELRIANYETETNENCVSAKLFVAGRAAGESQKVHNLRRAVARVSARSEVFVFVDSDARPGGDWLKNLIAPLADEKIGCATGYRWFISKKRNFASELRSVWNASIASALGANERTNFCWGGSTAIRRETFERLDIAERWRGTLSDDFVVTRRMKKANLPIRFVPQALTASVEDCGFRELLEFTTRQMKITRVYAPDLWIASLAGSFLFNSVYVWAIFLMLSGAAFWSPFAALALVSAFSVGKAHLRLKAVKLALKVYENDLNRQFWTQNTLWIFSPALFLFNSVRALFSRKIVWRGIRYELKSPEQTSIITENERL